MKRRVIALTLILLCGSATSLYWYLFPREPTYQGRSITTWLDAAAFQNEAWWPGQEATDKAVRAMGTNAVPFLLRRICHSRNAESEFRARIASWLWRHNFRKQAVRYYDPWGQERMETAIEGLHALGASAVPTLIEFYRGKSDDHLVALGCLGWTRAQEAIPFLLVEANSTNSLVRRRVFWVMGVIHTNAESVVPVLVKGLQDPDLNVRVSAASTLREFGTDAQQAVPALSRFAAEEAEALKSSPDSPEHRTAKDAAEEALDEITRRKVIFDSRLVSPQNPSGKPPPWQTTEPQPSVQPGTNR